MSLLGNADEMIKEMDAKVLIEQFYVASAYMNSNNLGRNKFDIYNSEHKDMLGQPIKEGDYVYYLSDNYSNPLIFGRIIKCNQKTAYFDRGVYHWDTKTFTRNDKIIHNYSHDRASYVKFIKIDPDKAKKIIFKYYEEALRQNPNIRYENETQKINCSI